MIKIYHNPRCKHSRAGLDYLKLKVNDIEIVHYLKEPLTENQINRLLKKTGRPFRDLLRTQEKYYKDTLKGRTLTDQQIVKEVAKNPKLLQRPIIEKDDKAILAHPPAKLDNLIQ